MIFFKHINTFIRNANGVAAILFAFSIPVIIGSAGIGIDLAKAYHTKNKLEKSLDAAALAGASSKKTGSDLETFVKEYAIANFKASSQATLDENSITVDTSDPQNLKVSATATSINTFMPFFSKDTVTVASGAVVNRPTGVEVVLVLDNSGSMNRELDSSDTTPRIEVLKTALYNFTDILEANIPDRNFLKIAVVPYGSTVNVGDRGLYGSSGSGLVQNRLYGGTVIPYNSDITSNDWGGCLLESEATSEEDVPGPFAMYRNLRQTHPDIPTYYNATKYSGNMVPTVSTVPSDWRADWTNFKCVPTPLLPLTDDLDEVRDKINEMDTSYEGATVGSIGMVWGWRIISPGAPFTEGSNYNDREWQKIVILMTDGSFNTSGPYGGYGVGRKGYIRDGNVNVRGWHHQYDNEDIRDKTVRICDKMKARGRDITIYTVDFKQSSPPEEVNMLKDCSTVKSGETGTPRYIQASSNDLLIDAFERIANSIAQTYLAE